MTFSILGEPCVLLPRLENGDSTCLSGITGTNCSFSCKEGFKLTGSETRQCKPNHRWSGTQAECKSKSTLAKITPDENTQRRVCPSKSSKIGPSQFEILQKTTALSNSTTPVLLNSAALSNSTALPLSNSTALCLTLENSTALLLVEIQKSKTGCQ